MTPRRHSNGRSPLVRKQCQITAFFSPGKSLDGVATPSPGLKPTSPSGSANPSILPDSDTGVSPPSSKRKKKPLIIAHSPEPQPKPAKSCSAFKQGEEVIGRRLRVFWPLDKAWYEGQIKSFDGDTGKHVILYDDAEEEILDLAEEQIEWTEETPRSFRRLRRRISASEPLPPFTNVLDDPSEISDAGEDSSGDEDWGHAAGEIAIEESEEMELDDEDSDERSKTTSSRKRKSGAAKKNDSAEKERSEVNSKKLSSVSSPGGNLIFGSTKTFQKKNEIHATENLLPNDVIERFGRREAEKFAFLREGRKDGNKRRPGDPNYDPRTLYLPPEFLKSLSGGQRQWWEFKAKHMDKVLFFKMGKFYELFEMDAHIGAKELELQYMKGEQPHCGFPEKNFSLNLEKLVRKGYRVLVIEQTETPEQLELRRKEMGTKDKVVKREICAVVTKGTLTEGDLLNMHADVSYILSLTEKSNDGEQTVIGICVVDTCTSRFMLGQFEDDSERQYLCSVLSELRPVEIIKPNKVLRSQTERAIQRHTRSPLINELTPAVEFWDAPRTLEEIKKICFPDMLTEFVNAGEEGTLAISALGGCLFYLKQCLLDDSLLKCAKFESLPLPRLMNFHQSPYMILDAPALENLEILENKDGGTSGTLLSQLDHCATAFGKRLLKNWLARPLYDVNAIVERQDAVSYFKGPGLCSALEFRKNLSKLPDMEKLLARVFANCEASGRNASKVILYEDASKKRLHEFITCLRGIETMAKACSSFSSVLDETDSILIRNLLTPGRNLPDVDSVLSHFKDAFDWAEAAQSGRIIPHPGVNVDYDSACKTIADVESSLAKYLKEQRKALSDSSINFANVGKELYLLEVPEDLGGRIPQDFELRSSKKGFFRYWTPKIKTWLSKLSEAEAERESNLKSILQVLIQQFSEHHRLWRQLVSATAELDVLICLAIARDHFGGHTCSPKIKSVGSSGNLAPPLAAEQLGHPILRNEEFVPNDVLIGGSENPSFVLLTGPNMGGKSTLLRQICLAVILAQIGADVPAETFDLAPVDRIFVRMGARDQIFAGRSTFLTELTETASMLSSATCNSLVILDELGRGTSTSDGQAIADSVLEYFVKNVRCRGLFSTHYHGLAISYKESPEVSLCHMSCHVGQNAAGIEEVTFLYKLRPGLCPKSYGVNVARLAGIPESVLEKAAEKSQEFEATYGKRKGGGVALLREFCLLSAGEDLVTSNMKPLVDLQRRARMLVQAS